MKYRLLKMTSVVILSGWLVGCANATGADVGTATGAGLGALAGYAIAPNNAVGAVVGAGAGAMIGREVGRNHDARQYRRSYHHGY